MPPKKAKTKAKAKPVSKTPTGSTATAAPATVVTNRGKEYDTTAAATRPRRATAPTPSVPVKAPANKTATPTTVTKKRGRPAHVADETVEPPKKRGRPAKVAAAKEKSEDEEEEQAVEPPKKRGRPAKSSAATNEPEKKKPGRPAKATTTAVDPPKKRGRPAKAQPEAAAEEDDELGEADNEIAPAEPPKKRGRPSTKQAAPAPITQPAKKTGRPSKAATDPAEAPTNPDTPAPRKRHSGRTGGPTTKISTDAADAADQLEDELVDEAVKSAKKGAKSKPSSSAVQQDAKESGKNYWLMKAEQVDRMETLKDGSEFNTKFTIDDLKGKSVPEPWEGVRNMVARNNMRAMKQGDLAFFYASQGKAPGITGIIEIVQEHEPDFTVTDESSIGYVEPAKRAKENQWSVVHVEFRKKLSEPVTLKELQKFSAGNGILSNMQVIKQSRLSVSKVSEKEWNFIIDNLIEGYEEDPTDGQGVTDKSDDDDGLAGIKVGSGPPLNPNRNGGGQAVAGAYVDEPEDVLPDLPALPVVNNTDRPDELPTSGSALPPTTHATSRPTSRQGSRPASRAGSHKPVSRQASLAPPALQTTEASAEVTMTETFVQESDILASAGLFVVEGSAKPAVSSRASSRAPSRAPSVQPGIRGSSLEPSVRPVSRGRSKTPNVGKTALMPSLIESPGDV